MKYLDFKPKTDIAALSIRLFLGTMFFMHGFGKPFVVGMNIVVKGFLRRGLPEWTAYYASFIEILCGILLVLGYRTRLAVLLLFPIGIGILVYHMPFGWVFHNAGGGYEYPQLIIVSLIALFFLGGGKYVFGKT